MAKSNTAHKLVRQRLRQLHSDFPCGASSERERMQRVERLRESCAHIRSRAELCSNFAKKDAVRMDDGKQGVVTEVIVAMGTIEVKLRGSGKVERYASTAVHKL